jgi:lantibiotic biosynthesis protein
MPSRLFKDYRNFGFFVLRTPLLPLDELQEWSEGATRAEYSTEETIAEDRAKLSQRLKATAARKDIADSIWVASPALFESLSEWFQNPESERGKRAERSFVRYFQRMCSRPTPFGLFAGCSTGSIAEKTNTQLGNRAEYHRCTRLDMNYLSMICDALLKQPAIRDAVNYKPNSSLYRVSERFRYVETRPKEKFRSHHLMAVEDSEVIRAVLQRAADGASKATLINALLSDEITWEEASAFIEELMESQILVPDFGFALTGSDPLDSLIDIARKTRIASETIETLQQASNALKLLDARGIGAGAADYEAINSTLRKFAGEEVKPEYQVDLIKPSPELRFSNRLIEEIQNAAELLLYFVRSPEEELLTAFREAFFRRYEGREVPLTDALDEESGIGFPPSQAGDIHSSLLDGITIRKTAEKQIVWREIDKFLLRKFEESMRLGKQAVNLDVKEIEFAFKPLAPELLPESMAICASVAARSASDLDEGRFSVLIQGIDSLGARLLGRFCCADDTMRQNVQQYLSAEEALHPDFCYAEIIHLSQDRLGNILFRPPFRSFEIPFLGISSLPVENQIPVSDLLISVAGDEIIIRSKRLNRRVIPRLTSAHNFHFNALGVYRLLCMLQDAPRASGFRWYWGPLENAAYLPRLTCGRIIFSLARWQLSKAEIAGFAKQQGLTLFRACAELRAKRQLPRFVMLADLDNLLMVDLENILSIEAFAHVVKNREQALLTEMFPSSDQLVIRDSDGAYMNEVIIPLLRKTPVAPRSQRLRARITTDRIERRFVPGSEWSFVKLYCGPSNCDSILRRIVAPLLKDLKSHGMKRWFFIRYSDPDWHLRIRFQGVSKNFQTFVLEKLEKHLEDNLLQNAVWKIQLDTYEREIERYGGKEGIELAEKFFHIDSETVLKLIQLADENPDVDSNAYWHVGIYGMDRLMSDFGFSADQKLAFAQRARAEFEKEFEIASIPNFKIEIAEKFRKQRNRLFALLNQEQNVQESLFLKSGGRILQRRSMRLKPILKRLESLDEKGTLTASFESIARSYIHMFLNRLFSGNQREQEFVLYDFLNEIYQSQAARRKQ